MYEYTMRAYPLPLKGQGILNLSWQYNTVGWVQKRQFPKKCLILYLLTLLRQCYSIQIPFQNFENFTSLILLDKSYLRHNFFSH